MATIRQFKGIVPCHVCGSREDATAFVVRRDEYLIKLNAPDPTVRYGVCKGCGLVYQNPRITHEVECVLYFEGCYRDFHGVPPEQFLNNHFQLAQREVKWILKAIGIPSGQGKRALEIGSGAGYGVAALQQAGWEAVGIEPEGELAAFGRQRYGVQVVRGYFTEDSFPGQSFDLIFTFNVFEHLLDPAEILRTAREKIKPDGFLFIFIPTFRRCHRKLTWIQFGSPHTVMFTHKTIGNLLAQTGFRLVKYSYHRDGELRVLAQPSEMAANGLPYQEDWRFIPWEIALQGAKYYLYYPAYAIPRSLARFTKALLVGLLGKRAGEPVVRRFIELKRRLGIDFY